MTLALLQARYEDLLGVCDDLEAIADGLPGNVSHSICTRVAGEVISVLSQTHRIESEVLLPILERSSRAEIRHLATRLRQEHDFDGQAAMEVEEALLALGLGTSTLSADALGYLLRSFFESVRRHVHSEQDLIFLLSDLPPSSESLH